MKKTQLGTLPVYTFSLFSRYPEIIHFSTTRAGGRSEGAYRSLNLGFHSGDNPAQVATNRETLSSALELNSRQMVFAVQTHSARVAKIDSGVLLWDDETRRQKLNETDALITREPGICIAVKTADCIPVLLFDPHRKAAAAIHAGWRGTVARIVTKTIEAMGQEYGTRPEHLIAGIGPGIGPNVYQVGPEVEKMVYQHLGEDRGLIHHYSLQENAPESSYLDLWKANYTQLVDAGLSEEKIEVAELCTFSHPEDFYSARRDGAATGRMATGIMIRK